MNYYSNLRPQLVDPKLHKTVSRLAQTKGGALTISDKISGTISSFYQNYIREHIFLTIILIAMAGFLIYRYHNRYQNRSLTSDEETEGFSNEENNILRDVTSTQTAHLRHDSQPTMNPLYPVDEQKEPVNYPPEPLPINIPDQGIMYTRNLGPEPEGDTPINVARGYNYNNVYDYPSRSYYTGGHNTYKNAQDTNIINPLGYPTNFNSSTGNFVGNMTRDNQIALMDYQTMLDNSQGNLIDSLNYGGPAHLDTSGSQFEMEPPYATD